MRTRVLTTLSLASVLLLAAPQTSHAYVDPGVGGMFYQIIVMGVAVVAGGLTVFRNKIKAMFGNKGQDDQGSDESQS